MNFRTTIILLILLLGVGAYITFTSNKGTTDNSIQQTNPQRLLDISSPDVSKVVITPADGKRIVLVRNTLPAATATIGPAQSDWKLTEPLEAFADSSKVSDLIDSVVSATSTAQVTIGASAAEYGLDTPQFTIDLDAGPKSARVFIGRQVKAGNELYVHVDGKDVAEVVAADLLDKVDTTPDKLRLAKLLNADATVANWVSIQRAKDPLDLQKVAGNWQISVPAAEGKASATQPTTLPAEQSVVTDLISAINSAAAVGFGGSTDDASLLIGRPQATLVISDQRPTTQPSALTETIEFGSPDSLVGKNVWVRVTPPGLLATVSKDTMDSILKTPLDLRDRQVLKLDPATVTSIRIVKRRPLTTQPIMLPAITHEVVLVRRPRPVVDLHAGPPAPTTSPTTAPTTLASTQPTSQPTTLPVVAAATQPASVWEVTGSLNPTDADDSKVDAVLAALNPLRADKFIPAPTSSPDNQVSYMVTITPATGSPVTLFFRDPGEASTDPVVGMMGDTAFNVPRTVITPLDVDFTKKP